MPNVETWLNQRQYRKFREIAEKEGISDYQLLKNLILKTIM